MLAADRARQVMNIVGIYRDTETIPDEWNVHLQDLIKSCWKVLALSVFERGGPYRRHSAV
jgi:hypothetical protein